ncbi:hypothetical protein ACHWQZ_G014325 [Mnemiopsis leidyi]
MVYWPAAILILVCNLVDSRTLSGILEPSQYDFFVFSFNSPLTFVLSTHAGDADLYITQSSSNPTYHDYDLLSATTGVEIIQIPESFSSPVRVGVFASAQYTNTSYSLEVSSDDPLTGNKKYLGKDASSWSWGDVFWFILEIVFEIMV